MNLIDKILEDWAYRVDNGMPNPNNPLHLVHLEETLNEFKLPRKVSEKLLQNLRQIKEDDIVKKKQDDGSYGSSYTVKKHSPDRGQKLVKKDASPEDIEKVEKGDDKDNEENSIDNSRSEDHRSTDAALNYTKTQEKKDKKSGKSEFDKGLGTHPSRAGEAATHKALRMLKEGKSYEQIEEMLMSIANDKDTFLDKSWVKASLAATKQIEQTFGIDNIDEIVWDTESGHQTIGVKNHGTSADMFVKLKDGTRVGISLKKDGKVFIKNGGYDEVFKQITADLVKAGVPQEDIERLQELASKQTYDIDLMKSMLQAASIMSESKLVKSVIDKIKSDDEYADNLGLLSRRDLIGEDFFQKIQEKIKNGKKLSGNEQKIMARIAAAPEVREKTPELYDEMRNADIRLTQRFLQGIQESPEIESAIKGEVLKGIHVEQILGVDDDMNMDKFITVYGIGDEGSQLSEETLLKMFGGKTSKLLKEIVNEHRENPTPESKKALVDELKSKIVIDYEDGAKDGIIKIKHEGPPEQEYSLFTIKSRARGIGAAPTLEMAQTTYMANVLAFGLDIEKWPSRQRKAFLKKQAEQNQ